MGLLDTLEEVLHNWKEWIPIAVIIAVINTLVKFLYPVDGLSIGLAKFLIVAALLGVAVIIIWGVYFTAVIKSQRIVNYKEAYTKENFVRWIKMIVTQTILLVPLVIIIGLLGIHTIIDAKSILEGNISILLSLLLKIFVILVISSIWLYIISPAGYVTIIKDSIIEGIKNFYKISLTFKFFIESIKVLLLAIVAGFIIGIFGIIPIVGQFIIDVLGFYIKLAITLYLTKVVYEIMSSKGLL